jgi:hypothetical protein
VHKVYYASTRMNPSMHLRAKHWFVIRGRRARQPYAIKHLLVHKESGELDALLANVLFDLERVTGLESADGSLEGNYPSKRGY